MKPLLMTEDDVQTPSPNTLDLNPLSSQQIAPSTQDSAQDSAITSRNRDGTPHLSSTLTSDSSTTTRNKMSQSPKVGDVTHNTTTSNDVSDDVVVSPTSSKHSELSPSTTPAVASLREEGNVYLRIAQVLLVIVVVIALLYVVYWIIQNVYKIDLWNICTQWWTGQQPRPLTLVDTPHHNDTVSFDVPTLSSSAPHADGVRGGMNSGHDMKKTLSDQSVSTLLDLMTTFK